MRAFIFSLLLVLGFTASAQRKTIVTVQYAGSIGYISLGGGVTSKTEKLQHELLYGFVPKAYGGPLDKITYRFTYLPFKLRLNEKITWRPINPVAFASYNIGTGYSLQPSFKKYDEDYYWWSPALRLHLGANTAVEIANSGGKSKTVFFLEANTNDRYITTWWDNTSNLHLTDIFFMGAGVKVLFN